MKLGRDDLIDFLLIIGSELCQPFVMLCFVNEPGEQGQCFFTVAPDTYFCFDVFIDLGRIDIEVNDFSLFGIFIQTAGYTVVKPHTYGNQDITLVC
ncbi:hypothetical protein D9M68_626390 [compost metagenome]